jgi:CMP/dCMP kinase
VYVIAMDGPAGSGKSTVARAVAARLGFDYLDTGAMYRAVAFAAIRRGLDPEDRDAVAAMIDDLELDVSLAGVTVDGVDATVEIRSPEITRAVSPVAANPVVRTELTRRMREWATRREGCVVEGRDIGSVVFPDAQLKLYVTASVEVRARRRHQELSDMDYDEVAAAIAERDERDRSRSNAPLVEVDGSVQLDTSDRSVDELVDAVIDLWSEAGEPS